MIRVLLAEDQGMVRAALAALLRLERDLEVAATVESGDEVLQAAQRTKPDIALLDIEMPGMDGLTAAEQLREHLPECKVVIVTTFDRPGYLRRAMEVGASGFLAKDGPASQLADAIRQVHRGGRVIDPDLAAAALRTGPNPLTPREVDVLEVALDGSPVADIAQRLSLTEGTVRNYLSVAMQKTGGRNRTEAARIARDNGWLSATTSDETRRP